MLRTTMLLFTVAMTIAAPLQAATVQLPKTGQTKCYDSSGTEIACSGTGQDGDRQAGVAWPNPRFTDNADGTVTDNLTGLVWLKNANCTDTVAGIARTSGYLTWANALTWSNGLASGACGLSDGSTAGQWRLPNRKELQSLVDRSRAAPALPSGHPFSSVQSIPYWSSSTSAYNANFAWLLTIDDGCSDYSNKDNHYVYVWPVRAGQ